MKTCIAVITIVSILTFSGPVLSQTDQGGPTASAVNHVDKGTLRFHIDTSVLKYRYNAKTERSEPFHLFWEDSPYANFGVGYAVIDRLLIGARMGFGFRDDDPDAHDPGDHYAVRLGFLPYIEYLFFPLPWLSPFVTGQLGVEGQETHNRSNWNFVVGGGGGLHFFVIPEFSMDLTGFLSYHGGHDKRKRDGRDREDKVPIHIISTTVLFGLSGWL